MTGSDLSSATWRKSSRSTSTHDSDCVEVAALNSDQIAARDSKNPNGPILHIAAADWTAFLTTIKHGHHG